MTAVVHRNFVASFWPSMLTLAVVLYATLWPDPLPDNTPLPFPHFDKLVHAVMMGGLAGAVGFDLCRSRRVRPLTFRAMAYVAVAVVVFSLVDEWLQQAMGIGRAADGLDFAADVVGCLVALAAAPPVVNRIFKNTKTTPQR